MAENLNPLYAEHQRPLIGVDYCRDCEQVDPVDGSLRWRECIEHPNVRIYSDAQGCPACDLKYGSA